MFEIRIGGAMLETYSIKGGVQCIIRKAVEKDAAEIVRYSNMIGGETGFLSYGENEFTYNTDQERQVIREYNEAKNRLFIVAVADGCMCGTLTFWGNSRKRLYHWGEFGISVQKKYWNMGIGHALLNYMMDWAKDGGIVRKIDLMVREDNIAAIALYEKMGFEIEGRIRRAMRVDNIFYDFLYMGKLID